MGPFIFIAGVFKLGFSSVGRRDCVISCRHDIAHRANISVIIYFNAKPSWQVANIHNWKE